MCKNIPQRVIYLYKHLFTQNTSNHDNMFSLFIYLLLYEYIWSMEYGAWTYFFYFFCSWIINKVMSTILQITFCLTDIKYTILLCSLKIIYIYFWCLNILKRIYCLVALAIKMYIQNNKTISFLCFLVLFEI